MKFLSAALPVLLLGLIVRADDKVVESPYYPLKVGNTWYYKTGNGKYLIKVAKFEDIDKQLCVRLEMQEDGKLRSVEHIAVKADGVYRCAFENIKAEPPVCILKLPPKKDDAWKIDTAIGTDKLKGTFKTGEVEEMTVLAGKFQKVVTVSGEDIDANGVKLNVTYYFAPNVGIIKQTMSTAGKEAVVIELEKFEAAK